MIRILCVIFAASLLAGPVTAYVDQSAASHLSEVERVEKLPPTTYDANESSLDEIIARIAKSADATVSFDHPEIYRQSMTMHTVGAYRTMMALSDAYSFSIEWNSHAWRISRPLDTIVYPVANVRLYNVPEYTAKLRQIIQLAPKDTPDEPSVAFDESKRAFVVTARPKAQEFAAEFIHFVDTKPYTIRYSVLVIEGKGLPIIEHPVMGPGIGEAFVAGLKKGHKVTVHSGEAKEISSHTVSLSIPDARERARGAALIQLCGVAFDDGRDVGLRGSFSYRTPEGDGAFRAFNAIQGAEVVSGGTWFVESSDRNVIIGVTASAGYE